MRTARRFILTLGLAMLSAPAWAALPQVANLQVQGGGSLSWNALPGSAGYNVYRGDIASLRTGNYGACLIGSVQGASVAIAGDPTPPVGTAVFFLVDGFDESGEGQLADPPGATPAVRCIPARRFLGMTPNGDPGDGLADGSAPLRNPDILMHAMHRQSAGVFLHSGELIISAEDLGPTDGAWKPMRGGGPGLAVDSFIWFGDEPSRADSFKWYLDTVRGKDHRGLVSSENLSPIFVGQATGGAGGGKAEFGEFTIHGDRYLGPDLAPYPVPWRPGADPDSVLGPHPWPWVDPSSVFGPHPWPWRPGADPDSVLGPHPWPWRTYRSQMKYSGPLGQGWDFPANARVAASGSNVIYADGAGRRETFTRLDATHFASPAGRFGVLLQNANGSFTMREPDGTLLNFHAFDGSNRSGALESAEDRVGDRSAFLYDNQGLLTKVVDPLGRAINYAYDANGRITSITDFAGRQVVYGYDANGNLTSARSPVVTGTPNGNDFPNGRTTRYAYSSGFTDDRLNGNLILVMRPNESASGLPAVQIVYGTDAAASNLDRVVSQTIGGTNASGLAAGGTLTLSYQSLNPGADPSNLSLPRRKAILLDRNGNRREFVHNANGNCLSLTELTNRNLRAGEPDYTTQFSYNSDGELILVMRPQGDSTQLVYDRPGADRYREGNLILVRSIADAHATGGRGDGHGGESNDVVRTFTYEPLFNQIATSTEPRGNDPAYVPQNGGANTPGRYTSTFQYDYQEGDPALNGVLAYAGKFAINLSGGSFGLGDLNGDGSVLQAGGNVVLIGDPGIHLDPTSMQAAINGPIQVIQTRVQWNAKGQPTAIVDAEQNRHEYQYYPESDPDGDGVATAAPPDGRVLDPQIGGFLKTAIVDTIAAPGRNNGRNQGPQQIQYDLKYDAQGTLAMLIDGRGVATRLIHNALGEMVEARRAAATADGSGPDGTPATGRGETGLTAPGFVKRYAYDADGNVNSVQREDQGTTRGVGAFVEIRNTYDILDDLVQTDQPATSTLTLTTQHRYDANQNRTRTTEPDGNSQDAAYDERDLLLSSTRGASGPLGGTPSTRQFAYDGDGALTRQTDGRGGLVDYLHDGHNRLARAVDQVGGTADLFYDPAGHVVRALSRGTAGGPAPTDRSGTGNVDLSDLRGLYDETGRRIRVDAMLFVPAGPPPARPPMITEGSLLPGDGAVNSLFEYDRLSRPTFLHKDSGALTRIDYDGAGRAITRTDPANGTTDWTYDAANNLIESVLTELPTTPGVPQEQFLTTSFYDALGRATMTVDNLGGTARAVYDSLDAVATASDANGPAGGSVNRRSPGHAGASVPVNAHGNVTRYTYDGAGRRLSTVAVLTATGKGDGTTSPVPDTSNPANLDGLITASTVWSNNGLPIQSLDDKGNVTAYVYDNLDRLVRTTRSDGTTAQTTLDAEDNPILRIDPNGTRVTGFFDLAGRLMARSIEAAAGLGGTTQQTFEHDGLGRLTRNFDNNSPIDPTDDANVTFIHDSLGRLLEEASGGGAAGGGRYSDLAWQAADLLAGLTYPSGHQVLYGYDGAERLRTMNDLMHPELMATFDYIGMGRLLTRQYGNGVRLTFLDDTGTQDTGYDGVGRPIKMRHLDPSNALLAGFEYHYDRNGNNTSARRLHDSDPLGNSRGNLYAYDSAGRLVSAREGMLDSGHNIVSPVFDQESWTLDGPGNWANLTRNGNLYLNTPNNLNEYDDMQCCGMHVDDGIPNDFMDLASSPLPDGLNLTYDRNGNQTDTLRQSLSFNFANLPAAARDLSLGAPVAAYAYDGLGRRMKRQVTGGEGAAGTEAYAYAGTLFPDAIEESDAAGGFTGLGAVGPGGGCLWHVHADGSSQYLLEDAFGSTVALVPGMSAGGGGVLERVVYDPYGKPTFESAGNEPLVNPASGTFQAESQFGNPHLFRGMRYDPELGARGTSVISDFGGLYGAGGAYNPNEGRFMSTSAPSINSGGKLSVDGVGAGNGGTISLGERAPIPMIENSLTALGLNIHKKFEPVGSPCPPDCPHVTSATDDGDLPGNQVARMPVVIIVALTALGNNIDLKFISPKNITSGTVAIAGRNFVWVESQTDPISLGAGSMYDPWHPNLVFGFASGGLRSPLWQAFDYLVLKPCAPNCR